MPQTPEEILAQNLRRGLTRRNHWQGLTPEERKEREEALTARIEAEREQREKADEAPAEQSPEEGDPTAAAYALNGENSGPLEPPPGAPTTTTEGNKDADEWDDK